MIYRDRVVKEFIAGDDAKREMRQLMTYGRGNMCQKRKKGRRRSVNSGLSSNIGWVTGASSLCLDYKEKKTQDKDEEMSQQVYKG